MKKFIILLLMLCFTGLAYSQSGKSRPIGKMKIERFSQDPEIKGYTPRKNLVAYDATNFRLYGYNLITKKWQPIISDSSSTSGSGGTVNWGDIIGMPTVDTSFTNELDSKWMYEDNALKTKVINDTVDIQANDMIRLSGHKQEYYIQMDSTNLDSYMYSGNYVMDCAELASSYTYTVFGTPYNFGAGNPVFTPPVCGTTLEVETYTVGGNVYTRQTLDINSSYVISFARSLWSPGMWTDWQLLADYDNVKTIGDQDISSTKTFKDTVRAERVPVGPDDVINKSYFDANSTVISSLLSGLADGLADNKPELTLVGDGGNVYVDIEAVGGGDVVYQIDGVEGTLDCTTGSGVGGTARILIEQGVDVNTLATTYVYVTRIGSVLSLNTSTSKPTGAFGWVAKICLNNAFLTEGPMLFQRTTESANDSRGQLSHERERLRFGSEIIGMLPSTVITTNAGSPDDVHLPITGGEGYQLHRQTSPPFTVGPYYYGNGPNVFERVSGDDLNSVLSDSEGSTLLNRRFNFVYWMALNKNATDCKIFVNIPNASYNNNDQAIADITNTADYSVPNHMMSVAKLIAKGVFRHTNSDNGTWEELLTLDIRGQVPGIRGGGATSAPSSSEFADSAFKLFGDVDPTKEAQFDVDSLITTGTLHTYNLQDKDGIIAHLDDLSTALPDTTGHNGGLNGHNFEVLVTSTAGPLWVNVLDALPEYTTGEYLKVNGLGELEFDLPSTNFVNLGFAGTTGFDDFTDNGIDTVAHGTGLTGQGVVGNALNLPIYGGVSGSYTNANITIDNFGKITTSANGTDNVGMLNPLIDPNYATNNMTFVTDINSPLGGNIQNGIRFYDNFSTGITFDIGLIDDESALSTNDGLNLYASDVGIITTGNTNPVSISANTIDLGTKTITNVIDPSLIHHAANKNYVDTSIANISVTGMTNPLVSGANTMLFHNDGTLLTPTGGLTNYMINGMIFHESDLEGIGGMNFGAGEEGFVWETTNTLKLTAPSQISVQLGLTNYTFTPTALSMATKQINNLADPTLDQDAATKKYVDDNVGGGGGASLIPTYGTTSNTVDETTGTTPKTYISETMALGDKYLLEVKGKLSGVSVNFHFTYANCTATTGYFWCAATTGNYYDNHNLITNQAGILDIGTVPASLTDFDLQVVLECTTAGTNAIGFKSFHNSFLMKLGAGTVFKLTKI